MLGQPSGQDVAKQGMPGKREGDGEWGKRGLMGVVECFEGDSCMVCRYGEREATSSEVVSCQEEGPGRSHL